MDVKKTVKRILKKSMKVDLGDKGLDKSWQLKFESEANCVHCKGNARIAFVAYEKGGKKNNGEFICEMHKNQPEGDGYWIHDSCAVAVYFCRKCLKATAIMNQG